MPGSSAVSPPTSATPAAAADLGRAVDELGDLLEPDLVRRDVVEQHQRLRAARGDVVDAVRGQVGAAVAKPPAGAGEDRASCRRRPSTRRAVARRRADAVRRTRRTRSRPSTRRRRGAARRPSRRSPARPPLRRSCAPWTERKCTTLGGRCPSRTARRTARDGPPGRRRGTSPSAPPTSTLVPSRSRPSRSASAPAFASGSSARSWSSVSRNSSSSASSSSIQSRGGCTSSR